MSSEVAQASSVQKQWKDSRYTYGWLALMVCLWGSSWPVTKLALNEVPPLWLATIRFGSAAICLFTYLILRKEFKLPVRKDLPIIASVGILQMTVFTGLGMVAMVHVDTSRAVLLAYTTPLWCVIASWILFRDRPSAVQVAALMFGLLGILIVCSPGELNWSDSNTLMGAGLLIAGAFSWALVILHIKKHVWASTPLTLAPWQMFVATLSLGVAAYAREGLPTWIQFDSALCKELFFIGPVATSACFVISTEYGRRISTFSMSNITLGVPLIGVLLSVIVLQSKLTLVFVFGLLLVLAAVVMSALAGRGNSRSDKDSSASLASDVD